MPYRRRIVDDELDELMDGLPAVALEGPKAVGKTSTALQRAATVHRLDDDAQRQIVRGDPERLTDGDQPVLIDEWQRMPSSWDVVRRAVDTDPSPGRFLLTGSATPTEHPTHSGAGRIATVRMRPLSIAERGIDTASVSLGALLGGQRPALAGSTAVRLADYAEEICRSGFPAIRQLAGRVLRTQLDSYVERIVERDFEELGHRVRNEGALRRWMAAYAAATATTASYDVVRAAASPGEGDAVAKTTTMTYRRTLEQLWLLDALPAWQPTGSRLSRLASAPKHHLADPALAARLLGATVDTLLDGRQAGPPVPRDGTLLGALFESLVTLGVRVYAQANEARVGHLRTQGGDHEVDLIVERGDGAVVAIEVKLTRAVTDGDVRHLRWLADRAPGNVLDTIVVTTGSDAYRRTDGIGVVPAALLGP